MIPISRKKIVCHLSTLTPELSDAIDEIVNRSFTDGEADIDSFKRQCRAFQMLFNDRLPQIGIKHGAVLQMVSKALGYGSWNHLSAEEKK